MGTEVDREGTAVVRVGVDVFVGIGIVAGVLAGEDVVAECSRQREDENQEYRSEFHCEMACEGSNVAKLCKRYTNQNQTYKLTPITFDNPGRCTTSTYPNSPKSMPPQSFH